MAALEDYHREVVEISGRFDMHPQLEKEFLDRRIRVFGGSVLTVFLIFFISFWYLQVVRGPYYEEQAGENIFRTFPLPAPRGLILDRGNRILAENRLSHNLFLTPRLSKNMKNTLAFLSDVLATTPEDLKRTLKREGSIHSARPVLIYQDLSLPQLAYISARRIEYPELEVTHEQKRSYPYSELFSHVIGYVGEITEQQDKSKEFPGAKARDIVGQTGLERFYNSDLMGRPGYEQKVVNSYGVELKEFSPESKPPVSGRALRLALDLKLQRAVEEAMYEGERKGSVVVMGTRTGEVLALYNEPKYDPNDFIPRIPPARWKALISDPGHPLQNRAVQNRFSPGSVFKIVMALAGLQEEKITPTTNFFCRGGQYIYNRTFRCWKPGGHGTVNLRKAIAQSCDVYFYNLGMRLDIDVIAHYSRLLGMGSLTEIDLPNETSGLVPDRQWKEKATREKWYPGETISVAIGQGPILATALQLASLLSTVSLDGQRVQPHLLNEVLDPEGRIIREIHPKKQQVVGIDGENYEIVKDALWAVVNENGTAARSRLENYDMCGKTGTVQVVGYDRGKDLSKLEKEKFGDHAWFVAFAPLSNPEVAVSVFVEHGGHGSEAAAPVAKKVLEAYFLNQEGDAAKGLPIALLGARSQEPDGGENR